MCHIAWMLPTAHRQALPQGLSYPLGAQALSEALAGTTRFDSLTLHFSAGYDSNARQKALEQMARQEALTVLSVLYAHIVPGRSSSNALVDSGYYQPRWELHLAAVPSEFKAKVKALLLSNALPTIRNWLNRPAESWGYGRKCLKVSVTLPELECALSMEESSA